MSITSNERYKKLFTSTIRLRNSLRRLNLIEHISISRIGDYCLRKMSTEGLYERKF